MIPRLYGPYWTFLDNAVVPKRDHYYKHSYLILYNKILKVFLNTPKNTLKIQRYVPLLGPILGHRGSCVQISPSGVAPVKPDTPQLPMSE